MGCLLSAELRTQLNKSIEWNQAKIKAVFENDLSETHFHQKDYIGFFLTQEKITLPELKLKETKILNALKHYCPHFTSEKMRVLVFSQIFIS